MLAFFFQDNYNITPDQILLFIEKVFIKLLVQLVQKNIKAVTAKRWVSWMCICRGGHFHYWDHKVVSTDPHWHPISILSLL